MTKKIEQVQGFISIQNILAEVHHSELEKWVSYLSQASFLLWWTTLPNKAHAREVEGTQHGLQWYNLLQGGPLHLLQYLVSLAWSG